MIVIIITIVLKDISTQRLTAAHHDVIISDHSFMA